MDKRLTLRVAPLIFLAAWLPAGQASAAKLTTSGQLDFSFGSNVQVAGAEATAHKPESKIFFTEDERWWAVLGAGSGSSEGVFLYELDSNHHWQQAFKFEGADPWAKADVLYQGSTLYVALRDNRSLSTNPRRSLLYRVTYFGGGAWDTPAGPTTITSQNPETLTIARDSSGRLWTAYETSGKIRVGRTAAGGTSFAISDLPSAPAVDSDDIAAVLSFGTSTTPRIGVVWSDQIARRVRFAWRNDSSSVSSPWNFETAYGGGVGGCPTATSSLCADDHINAKAFGDEIYVAIKTGLNDASSPNPSDPLIVLLHRNVDGEWSSIPVSPVSAKATRPIVLVAPMLDRLWVFASRASGVYVWESAIGVPGFASPTIWTKASGVSISNPTSTKQLISDTSGAVVETSAKSARQYWHNEFLP